VDGLPLGTQTRRPGWHPSTTKISSFNLDSTPVYKQNKKHYFIYSSSLMVVVEDLTALTKTLTEDRRQGLGMQWGRGLGVQRWQD
jgi:hypothetical protein